MHKPPGPAPMMTIRRTSSWCGMGQGARCRANKPRVVSRNDIIDAALGQDAAVFDRTIDVHITALRKKTAAASTGGSNWIQTVPGKGWSAILRLYGASVQFNEAGNRVDLVRNLGQQRSR
jgi:hypothetical protein